MFEVSKWLYENLKQEALIHYIEDINLRDEELANDISGHILQLVARDSIVQPLEDELQQTDIPVVCPTRVFIQPDEAIKDFKGDF